MGASFVNDRAAKDSAVEKLNRNAEEMAVFLNNANPNLPGDAATALFKAHVGNHTAQIDTAVAREMSKEADAWVEMKKNVYQIADALEAALVKQFPDRF